MLSKDDTKEELAKFGLSVKKTKLSDDDWDELIVPTGKKGALGNLLLTQFLTSDGDVIEVEVSKLRRVGNILRALRKATTNMGLKKTEFMHRYSKDGKLVYIKRLG